MVMATFFDLKLLIELVLIGTLLAYILVTFAVLVTRYVPDNPVRDPAEPVSKSGFAADEEEAVKVKSGSTMSERNGLTPRPENGSVRASELPPSPSSLGDDQSTSSYRKIRGSLRKQPTMSRSQSSAGSNSRRVTFGASLGVHEEGGTARSAPTADPEEHAHPPRGPQSSLGRSASLGKNNSASSPPPPHSQNQPSNSSNGTPRASEPSTPRTTDSDFKALDFHPLLGHSSSDDEDELLATDDILFQRQPPLTDKSSRRGGGRGGSNIRQSALDQNRKPDRVQNRKSPDLRKLLVGAHDEKANRGSLPLWLQIVTDVVDSISVSPTRIMCLLCGIYAVEIVMCVTVSRLWQNMADGSIVSLGLLGILSAIFVVLVGIVSFMPQSV